MGRSLTNVVNNLGLTGEYADAVRRLGTSLEIVADKERDAALGNGGLGRLAACFLDSMASLDLPGWGYGIRYKYGMFKQVGRMAAGRRDRRGAFWSRSRGLREAGAPEEMGRGSHVAHRCAPGAASRVHAPPSLLPAACPRCCSFPELVQQSATAGCCCC
jgi:hypothetical protein